MNNAVSHAVAARRLLRATRLGTLATTVAGQPFASLVTPAVAPDGSILLLLSDLSEHTRHLGANPRCALMVVGAPEEVNPQTAPRVTITGQAALDEHPALQARYLAIHPYAALYAGFGDFHLWRLRPLGGLFVGGFGRAGRLRAADLAPGPVVADAIAAAEPALIAHCNDEQADALARIAGEPGTWRLATLDADGFDLAQGERVRRIPWSRPATSADDIRKELAELTASHG